MNAKNEKKKEKMTTKAVKKNFFRQLISFLVDIKCDKKKFSFFFPAAAAAFKQQHTKKKMTNENFAIKIYAPSNKSKSIFSSPLFFFFLFAHPNPL